MPLSLEERVRSLEGEYFTAIGDGPRALAAFNARYVDLLHDLQRASEAAPLPEQLKELVYRLSNAVIVHTNIVRSYDASLGQTAPSSSPIETDVADSTHILPNTTTTLPLFRYFLSNICFPYPESEDKERLAQEVRDLGWRDFDKRKLEDWLNRKRNQSGFVSILRQYCHDDREAMRRLCHIAFFGPPEERDRLPDGAAEDLEDMRDFLQCQYDELAEERDTTWVDELATGVHAILDEDCLSDNDSCRHLSDDSDCDSDAASDWSSTDVEDDEDDTEGPPCAVIGAKRKLSDSCDSPPSLASRPLARSFSMASSVSSSSTACSLRSVSAASVSNVSSVDWDDDEDMCSRPLKRIRAESICVESESIASPSTVAPTSALFTSYRTKRKSTDDGFAARTRSIKRSRYAALGVAPQNSAVTNVNLEALSDICAANWTLSECTVTNFDVDAYSVDCTQPNSAVEIEDLTVFAGPDQLAEDILTWSKLQVYTIYRMLLPASARPLPPALAQSMTLSFDTSSLSAHDITSLCQLFALTPEDITAMYESMNTLGPSETSSSAEVVSPPEDSPSPTSPSSSECSSPPALSDDSGSSTRSSSVEPGSEQCPLLVSPAVLSAEYNQLCDDLFCGKTLGVSPSQVNVELGATPDVHIATDELDGAADLLARYLRDSMNAA